MSRDSAVPAAESVPNGGRPPVAGSIGLVFACLWSVLAALALRGLLQPLAIAAGASLSLLLIARLWRSRKPGGSARTFRRKRYMIAVILEVAALYAVGFLLPQFGMGTDLIPAVGIVVGLHFIGLWWASALDRFLWIAGCMSAVSLLSMLVPDLSFLMVANPRNAACGLGNAIVLWSFAGRA